MIIIPYIIENPFPSGYHDVFFDQELLNTILEEFSDLSIEADIKFTELMKKLATNGECKLEA